MTLAPSPDLKAAQACIQKTQELIELFRKGGGAKESNVRHTFTSYLRLIFPDTPWWVEDHISRGEANSAFSVKGKAKTGFVDNLVGLTAIEYETDLENPAKYKDGLQQVRNYCAALINKGNDPELVLGVLSDTVRWRAFRVASVVPHDGLLGGEHLSLEEIDATDLSSADETAAKRLVAFLDKHLGRKGSRPLSASTIAHDLGFGSTFCTVYSKGLQDLVSRAFSEKPKYAELIAKLWCSFVTYLRDRGSTETFEVAGYADELYILTLAKLICANVIERKALLSDGPQVEAILDGRYFASRGLVNLVEYDYFGWLNQEPFIKDLLPIARGIQSDLEAYDFASPASEDLFGRLMAQLAKRTQRLLLGQEWTPAWLAARLVGRVFEKLPPDEDPRLVDMCCGSGAMIVEAIKRTKLRIAASGSTLTPDQKLQKLSTAITGFDIDPLAVMLSKISWVLASQDLLGDLHGAISIPVYHADSLFAITPLSSTLDKDEEQDFHELKIAEYKLKLPTFLLSPEFQPLFDAMLSRSYAMVVTASGKGSLALSEHEAGTAIDSACAESGCGLSEKQRNDITAFLPQLVQVVDALNRDGRNGIWIFVLRNSYRPGLVSGQFNGLVSNPPWLALSKIADNPYKEALRQRAEAFGIKPEGPSHLHIELATIFLLHAVDRYLRPGAAIGCIVPDTVLNGHHHNPFRKGSYAAAKRPVAFQIEEVWRVQRGTFKNEACVLFGTRSQVTPGFPNPIPGALAQEASLTPLSFARIQRGNREAWTDTGLGVGKAGFFDPAPFRQGADIMPRTLLFHEIAAAPGAAGGRQWTVRPIDKSTSKLAFVIKDAKQKTDFQITPTTVPDRFVFDVLTSNLLTPFELVSPLKALLPIERNSSGKWSAVGDMTLAATPMAKAAFDEVLTAFGPGKTVQDLFNALDSDRHKLTQQAISSSGYLVVMGAGGTLVCAAYTPVATLNLPKLVIDQTLYWVTVPTEDEAIYLTGLLNSEAINLVIREFQPRGAFGERHIHTLPLEATPPFDPAQVAHQDVVQKTKQLIAAYRAIRATDPDIIKGLDPGSSTLAPRRNKIRSKLKQLLPYGEYEDACRALYGV